MAVAARVQRDRQPRDEVLATLVVIPQQSFHLDSDTAEREDIPAAEVALDLELRAVVTRANVVARELVRQGIPAQAVFVVALSDSKPLFYEVMPAGDAGNQRVEIYFVN